MAINLNSNNGNTAGSVSGNNGINNPNAANNADPDSLQNNPSKANGTGFTNLNKILTANQNNNLGQTVQNGVQNVTNQTANQTQQAQTDFNNSLVTAVQDINNGNTAVQNLSNVNFGTNEQGSENALQNIGGRQYVNSLDDLRNGYQGETGLENSDALQTQAQNLTQLGQGLSTDSGRQAALQQFVNAGPNYTENKQQLDNVLLGQDTTQLNQARQNALQTASQTNQAINNAAQQGTFTQQQFNSLNPQIQNLLNSAATNLGSTLTNLAGTDQSAANAALSSLNQNIAQKALTEQQAGYLNTSLGGNTLYNLTPADLQTLASANQYTQSGVADQGEYNAAQTLAALAGGTNNLSSLPQLNSSQIGTQTTGTLASELNNNSTAGQALLNTYQQQAQAAQNAINGFNYSGNDMPITPLTPQSGVLDNINYNDAKNILGNSTISSYIPNESGQYDTNYQNTLAALSGLAGQGYLGTSPNITPVQNNTYIGPTVSPFLNNDLTGLQNQYNQLNTQYGLNNTIQNQLEPATTGTANPQGLGPAINPAVRNALLTLGGNS